MASFTDAISQFNPYVAQLPVEAMAKVGMQKQAQYEQGVQKIQAYIDNIAGMDVAHDADKSYLQSKMNQLGNNLKVVAGGDFSNQQLVNSVGGMATQIIKDPNIQNAVASTAWYKKQKQQLDADYQAGKSSIANVRDFDRQANKWLSNNEIGQTFRGRYSPYIDVEKKWREIVKSINPGATTEEFMYENYVGPNGTVQTDKLAAAMTKITKEGVSAETIENAIRASLTPDDLNQIRIDANYRFENTTPDDLRIMATSTYGKNIDYLDKLEKNLSGVANLSTSDPIRRQQALDTIEQIKTKRLNLKSQLQDSLGLIDKDPEAVKVNMYKEGFIDQFAKSYSWEKKALEYLSNPALQASFEKQRIDISRRTLEQNILTDNWNRFMDQEKLKIDKDKQALEIEKLYGKSGGYTAYYGAAAKNLADPYTAINTGIASLEKADVEGVAALAKKIGMSPAALDASLDSWKIDPKLIGVQYRGDAQAILDARRDVVLKKAELERAREDAFKDNPSLFNDEARIQQALKSKSPVNITLNGNRYTFSPNEVYDYLRKEKAGALAVAPGVPGGAPLVTTSIDESMLTPREKVLNQALRGSTKYKYTQRTGKGLSVDNVGGEAVADILRTYTPILNKTQELEEKIRGAISTRLAATSGTYVPALSPITTATAEAKDRYRGIADVALKTYNFPALGIKGGDAMLSNSDVVKAQSWLSGEGKEDVIYSKLRYNDTTYLVLTKGTEDVLVPLPAAQAQQLPPIRGEENVFAERINRIQNTTPTNNTNPKGTISGAFYQSYKMPNLKNTVVVADLQRDSSDPSLQYINFAIKTPTGFKHLQLDNYPMNAQDADMFIRTLTDDKIKNIYLQSNAIPEAWKEQIKNL